MLRHSSWEPTSPIERSPTPTPFREVPVLPYLILQRCGVRLEVKTNSLRHAKLTGNWGSPTPIGTEPKFESIEEYARWNIGPSFTLHPAGGSAVRRSTRIRASSRRVRTPMLSPDTGDVPRIAAHLHNSAHSGSENGTPFSIASNVPVNLEYGVELPSQSLVLNEEYEGGSPLLAGDNEPAMSSPEIERMNSSPPGLGSGRHTGGGIAMDDITVNRRDEYQDAPNVRSPRPYNFRNRTRELVAQIRDQARITGLPFDGAFLREAKIKKHYPALHTKPCPRSLLQSCEFGIAGITVAEFGSILKCCATCDRYIFIGSTSLHTCNPIEELPDITSKNFHLTTQLLLKKRFPGLSEEDLAKLFLVCDTCHRVHSVRFAAVHHCPDDVDEPAV